MPPKAAIFFTKRGLTGLLLIAAGITLGIVFNKHSAYTDGVKHLMYSLALVLAVGGGCLVSSYVHQRSFKDMRQELYVMVFMVTTLVLISLTNS
jgi:hypothetical protein